MKRVYVAGPYTKGDVAVNVANAMACASELIRRGYNVFCPHLFHFLHMHDPQEYDKWLSMDLDWLPCCDILFRIPGESPGAEAEVEAARKAAITVVTSFEELDVLEQGWATDCNRTVRPAVAVVTGRVTR